MKPLEAIRCTVLNCTCECFAPGKAQLRTCETCKHGWVAHALDKLGFRHMLNLQTQVEMVQPNIVFDVASLMLYGTQATPIRLKILLDRLFSVLQHEEVLQVLHGFGWTYEDYARGYILQDSSGRVLDKWLIASREEEQVIIQQFLRFGETKAIAQEIILQDTKEKQEYFSPQKGSKAESDIKKFIERSNLTMQQNYLRPFDARHLFVNRLPFMSTSSRLLTPPALSSFAPTSPSRELRPPLVPIPTSSPLSSTPLGRLQTLQPFDYRLATSSPSVSPGLPENKVSGNSSTSGSPQNVSLSSTPPPQSSPPPYVSPKLEKTDESQTSMLPIIPAVVTADNNSSSNDAINYSTKVLSHTSDLRHKFKHVRKPSNPVKRIWQPSANFGSTFIGPNGKKRVLCTACNKTFCDKGALKIHYSAVHLKEMHKCSVEGCNMMFSSRRSRNRHSANPNPKLHMPQKRKIPDGATILESASPVKLSTNTPPTMVVAPSMLSRNPLETAVAPSLLHAADQSFFVPVPSGLSFLQSPEKRYRIDNTDDDEGPTDLSKKAESREDDMSDIEENERPELGVAQHFGSRRKKMAPTRCAQRDELMVMNDDNSNDREPKHLDNTSIDSNGYHSSAHTDMNISIPEQKEHSSEDGPVDMADQISEEGEGKSARNFPQITSLLSVQSSMDSQNKKRLDGSPMSNSSSVDPMSDQDSNLSVISNDSHLESPKTNGTLSPSIEIPIDKENPLRCTVCSKIFQNHFTVKQHYQNVHLKLLHMCTVEGCNAAFPSKRSRDRHSANLNLHRKLLSTSDDAQKDTDKNINGRTWQEEINHRLYSTYDSNSPYQVANGVGGTGSHSDSDSDDSLNDQVSLNGDEGYEVGNNNDLTIDDIEEGETAAKGMVECHLCEAQFRDNLVLKEHFELAHPKEMFRCTVFGCDKIFSTRKSRNRHSQNDNLHRHISPIKGNGIS